MGIVYYITGETCDMSIFPKRIRKNENVIIHFKIENIQKLKFIQYVIEIISEDGNIVKQFKKEEIFNEIHEIYFPFESNNMVAGKYYVRSRAYLEGRVIGSFSSIKDFFFIDDISIEIENIYKAKFYLTNNGNSVTPYSLLNKEGKVMDSGELEPFEKRIFLINGEPIFLKYANNHIEKVCSEEKVYVKSNTTRWRIRQNCVEVLDEKRFNLFKLNKKETAVWLNIDGINSVDEIYSIVGFDNKESLNNLINTFLKDNLICRIE